MKLIKESKEKLPISLLTDFVSRGWSEVGSIKETIISVKNAFKDSKKFTDVLEQLEDAYLVSIGQLEEFLDSKNYVEFPETEKTKVTESLEEQPVEECKDGSCEEKTEEITEEVEEPIEDEEVIEEEFVENEPTKEITSSGEPFEFFTDFDDPEPKDPEEI